MRAEQITESAAHTVHGQDPHGDLDAVIELPTTKATACAFAGESLTELLVATSRDGLAAGEGPVTGSPIRELAG